MAYLGIYGGMGKYVLITELMLTRAYWLSAYLPVQLHPALPTVK